MKIQIVGEWTIGSETIVGWLDFDGAVVPRKGDLINTERLPGPWNPAPVDSVVHNLDDGGSCSVCLRRITAEENFTAEMNRLWGIDELIDFLKIRGWTVHKMRSSYSDARRALSHASKQ